MLVRVEAVQVLVVVVAVAAVQVLVEVEVVLVLVEAVQVGLVQGQQAEGVAVGNLQPL